MLEEALPAVLKAMRGSRTPAFFLICPPDGNGTEEGGTDEKTREAVLKEMLANRDLELMTVMVLTERDRAEAFCGAALSIRGTLCARSHAADSGVEKS